MISANAGSLGQFNATMDRWAAAVPEKADLLVKGVCQTVFTEIQAGGRYSPGTPIANPATWQVPRKHTGGYARANWFGGIGAVPDGTVAFEPGDAAAAAAAAQAQQRNDAVALSAKAGDIIYLANHAPYIRRLEFGWSRQAPIGMVRQALRALQAIVDEVGAHVAGRV